MRLRSAPSRCSFSSPIVFFFVVSFWEVRLFKLNPTFTFANYVRTYEEYFEVALFTFGIAALIATITTFLGFTFTYVIRFKAGRFGPVLLFGAIIALFGGYLAKVLRLEDHPRDQRDPQFRPPRGWV